jgi:hypothetical protein
MLQVGVPGVELDTLDNMGRSLLDVARQSHPLLVPVLQKRKSKKMKAEKGSGYMTSLKLPCASPSCSYPVLPLLAGRRMTGTLKTCSASLKATHRKKRQRRKAKRQIKDASEIMNYLK